MELKTEDVDQGPPAGDKLAKLPEDEVVPAFDVILMEPIMRAEVFTPEEYLGDVIADINTRRGQIQDIVDQKGIKILKALIPLGETFGYITDLRSLTQGRGNCNLEPAKYARLTETQTKEVLNHNNGISAYR